MVRRSARIAKRHQDRDGQSDSASESSSSISSTAFRDTPRARHNATAKVPPSMHNTAVQAPSVNNDVPRGILPTNGSQSGGGSQQPAPSPPPVLQHLPSRTRSSSSVTLPPLLNRAEYEQQAEEFNFADEDLLLDSDILPRTVNSIQQASPLCYEMYRDIRNQMGNGNRYWHTVDGAEALMQQWITLFSWLPEFLKYAPSAVRNAFWETRPANTISANLFDSVLPNRVIIRGRGDYTLQDVMTEEEEQQEEALKLARESTRKRRHQEKVENEPASQVCKRRVVAHCRVVNTPHTFQPLALAPAPAPTPSAAPAAALAFAPATVPVPILGPSTAAPPAPVPIAPVPIAGPFTAAPPVPIPGILPANTGPPLSRVNRGVTAYAWSPGRVAAYRLAGTPLPPGVQQLPFHPMESNAPSPEVDITHLGNTAVSAVELLTFFPLHTIWRWLAWRLSGDWGCNEIVKFILFVRNIRDPLARKATTLWHQVQAAERWANHPARPVTQYALGSIDTERSPMVGDLEDYRLVDLAINVAHMPTGGDRGLLTAAIELAIARGDNAVMLSEFPQYVQTNRAQLQNGLQAMSTDQQAFARWFGANSPDAQNVKLHCATIGYRRS